MKEQIELHPRIGLHEMLHGFVFIASGSRIAWSRDYRGASERDLKRRTYSIKDLELYFTGNVTRNHRGEDVPTFSLWLHHPARYSAPTLRDAVQVAESARSRFYQLQANGQSDITLAQCEAHGEQWLLVPKSILTEACNAFDDVIHGTTRHQDTPLSAKKSIETVLTNYCGPFQPFGEPAQPVKPGHPFLVPFNPNTAVPPWEAGKQRA